MYRTGKGSRPSGGRSTLAATAFGCTVGVCPDVPISYSRSASGRCSSTAASGTGTAASAKSRQDYWEDKFAKNVARDRRNTALLTDDGWHVFVAWECEVDTDEALLQRLMEFLGPPRSY